MCWRWPHAPLAGVKHVAMTVERVAWRFGDETRDAVVRPKASGAGEVEIHADSCSGPLLATLPLVSAARGAGPTTLRAGVLAPGGGVVRDLCIFATGDPRDGQWALARLALSQ